MQPTKDHGPVANGTATGYSTGDAMFKAAAETDLPRRARTPDPEHPHPVATTPTWRLAGDDDAEERREPVRIDERERASADEPSERSD